MSNFVVDTNLLVSAAIIKNTLPFRGIEKIIREGHSLVFSTETFHEIETGLQRPKFDRYDRQDKREKFLSVCAEAGVFVIPQKHFMHCRDEKDNQFLDVAVAGEVEALISGDKDLLELKDIEGIPPF